MEMISSAENSLTTSLVKDVMTPKVVTVAVNNTMSEAADVFFEHQITGAPVVDELGHCVGMLSATDFVHSKAEELEGRSQMGNYLCSGHPSGLYSIDEVRHDLVKSHMSSAIQTMDQNAPLLTAAHCMCLEHVHRLLVIDSSGSPVGILSSLDLIANMISGKET
jgi:predicted transcriptional regulator